MKVTVHGLNMLFYVIARPFSKAEAISNVLRLRSVLGTPNGGWWVKSNHCIFRLLRRKLLAMTQKTRFIPRERLQINKAINTCRAIPQNKTFQFIFLLSRDRIQAKPAGGYCKNIMRELKVESRAAAPMKRRFASKKIRGSRLVFRLSNHYQCFGVSRDMKLLL